MKTPKTIHKINFGVYKITKNLFWTTLKETKRWKLSRPTHVYSCFRKEDIKTSLYWTVKLEFSCNLHSDWPGFGKWHPHHPAQCQRHQRGGPVPEERGWDTVCHLHPEITGRAQQSVGEHLQAGVWPSSSSCVCVCVCAILLTLFFPVGLCQEVCS